MSDRLSSSPLRLLGTRADITELAAINTTILKNGAIVFVTGVEDYFYLSKDSVAAADGSTIIASATGSPGRWFRMFAGGGQSFATQANWYIDPVDGDDGNNGETAATALATMGELQRRLNGAYINQATVVHILNDVPSADAFVPVLRIGPAGGLRFNGENPTTLATRTLSGVVQEASASNTRGSITSAGFDWTPYIAQNGQRVRITAGGNVGAVSFLQKIGGATDTAFVCRPQVPGSYSSTTFTNGDTVVVEQMTELGKISLGGVSVVDLSFTTGGPIEFFDLYINNGAAQDDAIQLNATTAFNGCQVQATYIKCNGESFFETISRMSVGYYHDGLLGAYGGWFEGQAGGSYFFGMTSVGNHERVSYTGYAIFNACPYVFFSSDVNFWDWAAGAAMYIQTSMVHNSGSTRIWGTSAVANTYAVKVEEGEYLYRTAAPPTLVGALTATKDIQVGPTSGTYAALIPFMSPESNAKFIVNYGLQL